MGNCLLVIFMNFQTFMNNIIHLLCFAVTVLINSLVKKIQKIITFRTRHIQVVFIFIDQ